MEDVRAWLPGPVPTGLVEARERTGRHCHAHLHLLARSGSDRREGGEHAERSLRIVARGLEINLHDLPACALAGVPDRDRQRQVLARHDRLDTGRARLVAPVGVAPAVAEGEMRLGAGPVIAAVADQQALGIAELAGLLIC